METKFYLSKFNSGENSVELTEDSGRFIVKSNESPVFSSDRFPDALSRYYREISAINKSQLSGYDNSMNLFGDEVVRLNRIIIPKLGQLGRLKEASYLKALNKSIISSLQETIKSTFFKDDEFNKFKDADIFKADPASFTAAGQLSVNGNSDVNQGSGETVTPSKLNYVKIKKLDDNTYELKSINGMQPAPEEAMSDRRVPVEKPIKVSKTYQQKLHPSEQRPLDGNVFEINKVAKARISRDEAFAIGRKLKVDFNTIHFDQFVEGINAEAGEHKDVIGNNKIKAAKIALAHLKEVPDYYAKLDKYVETDIKKDFPKMVEGEQRHDGAVQEDNSIGKKQNPIEVKKAAFSPDAPKVITGETQDNIDGSGYGGKWSKEQEDNKSETDNISSAPKEIKLHTKKGDMSQIEGGGDVRDGRMPYFASSLNPKQVEKILKMLLEDNNESGI
jgi:hypothetical protein